MGERQVPNKKKDRPTVARYCRHAVARALAIAVLMFNILNVVINILSQNS
jgi:hypothetical protein